MARSPQRSDEKIEVVDKGLKANAVSLLSNVVFGVASTAPAYSLAAGLGVIAGLAGSATPGIILVALVPMLCIVSAYYHLNRADPDCGTVFSWGTLALGPQAGWMGGWAVIITDIIAMPGLAMIAGQYSLELFDVPHPAKYEIALVGVGWIALMTAGCYFGIEISARMQQILLAAELAILVVFAAAALAKVFAGAAPSQQLPSLDWFNPFAVDGTKNFTEAVLAAVFIYWGWDCGLSVNEETENPASTPGRAAFISTGVLAGIYVIVAVAALAFAGPTVLAQNPDDIFVPIGGAVLGSDLDKLLILAVLTSASASTQTTILPTARTAISMARAGAIPKLFGHVNARYLTPDFATIVMGIISAACFVGLIMLSQNVLKDSILALGIGIAFYYALAGFSCVVYYRRQLLRSVNDLLLMGLLPGAGALVMAALFARSCTDLWTSGTTSLFGIGGPLLIGLGGLLAGLLLIVWARRGLPHFFARAAGVAHAAPTQTYESPDRNGPIA